MTLPEQLAGGIGEVAGDAAEHWEAASGESGDGSRSIAAGERRFVAAVRDGSGRGGDIEPAIERTAERSAQPARAPERADRRRSSRPGRPGHRRASARSARRGRLSARRSRHGGPASSAARRRGSSACSRALQEFDPPGVFARDLAECLALQLRDRDRLDPAMQRLLEQPAAARRPQRRGADAGHAGSMPRISPR